MPNFITFLKLSITLQQWKPDQSTTNNIWRQLCENGGYEDASISSDQSLSHVRLFATPWIAACQAFLSITNSRSSPKIMSIKSVMPSSHLTLCRPLLLLPPIPPSIRVFSNESTLRMRWPKSLEPGDKAGCWVGFPHSVFLLRHLGIRIFQYTISEI